MHVGDARADPAVVDLIELAGLWLAADDRPALRRGLQRLIALLEERFAEQREFRARFVTLLRQAHSEATTSEELRRSYRRATLG
jgi:hypothetical protein